VVVTVVGIVIAYLSLSPTLMLFYGSFRTKALGVKGTSPSIITSTLTAIR
jgi:hypothetical protein